MSPSARLRSSPEPLDGWADRRDPKPEIKTKPRYYDSWEECWEKQATRKVRLERALDAYAVLRRKAVDPCLKPVLLAYALHRLDRPFSRPSLAAVGASIKMAPGKVGRIRRAAWETGWLHRLGLTTHSGRYADDDSPPNTRTGKTTFVRLASYKLWFGEPSSLGPMTEPYQIERAILRASMARAALWDPETRRSLPGKLGLTMAAITAAGTHREEYWIDPERVGHWTDSGPGIAGERMQELIRRGWIIVTRRDGQRLMVKPNPLKFPVDLREGRWGDQRTRWAQKRDSRAFNRHWREKWRKKQTYSSRDVSLSHSLKNPIREPSKKNADSVPTGKESSLFRSDSVPREYKTTPQFRRRILPLREGTQFRSDSAPQLRRRNPPPKEEKPCCLNCTEVLPRSLWDKPEEDWFCRSCSAFPPNDPSSGEDR